VHTWTAAITYIRIVPSLTEYDQANTRRRPFYNRDSEAANATGGSREEESEGASERR